MTIRNAFNLTRVRAHFEIVVRGTPSFRAAATNRRARLDQRADQASASSANLLLGEASRFGALAESCLWAD